MKLITLARDVLPHKAGQDVVVPEHIAAAMRAAGEVARERPFPLPEEGAPAPTPGGYRTRDRRPDVRR